MPLPDISFKNDKTPESLCFKCHCSSDKVQPHDCSSLFKKKTHWLAQGHMKFENVEEAI